MDDHELEQAMRAGLERQAERVEVDVAVADRARRAADGRRTTRWWVGFVAAAAVAAIAVTGVVVTGDDPVETADPPVPGTTRTPDPDLEVRTELWHGVQVDVPADWGWGSTPGVCGAPPVDAPYVGRPISDTDACGLVESDATPSAPYVWFDGGVAAGVVDLGEGWTRETVEANGVRVSVATDDEFLRERILASVAAPDLCAPTLDGVPRPRFENTTEGNGPFVSGRLCAYREGDLVYGTAVGAGVVERTYSAVGEAPKPVPCAYASFETVVLSAVYEDPYTSSEELWLDRDVVYDLTCGVASIKDPFEQRPTEHRVTEATVPWAGPQFRHLLVGPFTGASGWVYERFIGIQG